MYRAHASWGLLPDRQNGAVYQARHCVGTGLLDHPPTGLEQHAGDGNSGSCGYEQGA